MTLLLDVYFAATTPPTIVSTFVVLNSEYGAKISAYSGTPGPPLTWFVSLTHRLLGIGGVAVGEDLERARIPDGLSICMEFENERSPAPPAQPLPAR